MNRLKQRSFVVVFGWWKARDLLLKHGFLAVPDDVLAELFASDAEDEWSEYDEDEIDDDA